MDKKTRNELKLTLSKALEDWWEGGMVTTGDVPWLGKRIFSIMADAAVAVLDGISDSEKYLRKEGYLKD